MVHETNYFIRTIRNEHFWSKEIGESNIVLFSEPWISTTPRYLCVDPENFDPNIMKNLEMLAHKICVAKDYPTFDWIGLKNISSNFRLPEISHIQCFQRDDLSIECIRSRKMDEVNRSCHFLSLKCGSCQRKYHILSGMTFNINSPLYPVLQPGLVCQYDFEHWLGSKVDLVVNITDLGLGPRTNDQHCGSSFLDILAGDDVNNLQSVSTSCGEEQNLVFHLKQKSFLRLRLVTGGNSNMGERGFVGKVTVIRKNYNGSGKTVVIVISCVLLFFLVCAISTCIVDKLDERRRQRRRRRRNLTRRVMRYGSGPLSYHQQRTERLRAEMVGVRVEDDGRGDNIYMIDTSVPRRLPHLPPFNFSLASNKQEDENNNDDGGLGLHTKSPDGFKLYETISLIHPQGPTDWFRSLES